MTAQNDGSGAGWAGRGSSPDLTGMVGLDWAPKPVRPGRGSGMAKEGGEQGTAWAPRGSGPVGRMAHIPQPHPRWQVTTPHHLPQDVLEAMPCWVRSGGVCVWGGRGPRPQSRVPALGALGHQVRPSCLLHQGAGA